VTFFLHKITGYFFNLPDNYMKIMSLLFSLIKIKYNYAAESYWNNRYTEDNGVLKIEWTMKYTNI